MLTLEEGGATGNKARIHYVWCLVHFSHYCNVVLPETKRYSWLPHDLNSDAWHRDSLDSRPALSWQMALPALPHQPPPTLLLRYRSMHLTVHANTLNINCV